MASTRPSLYMGMTYHNLLAPLHDGTLSVVPIDRYLNAGITNNPTHARAVRAHGEKDLLLGKISEALGHPGTPPSSFVLDGRMVARADLQRTFSGKGSPAQIRTTLWVASKFGRLTSHTARTYTDNYIGLDCNGFVGNYWGMDANTEIDAYDKNPRRDPKTIEVGDALIFYHRGGGSPFHIAVIDDLQIIGTDKIALTIVQSAGLELGLERKEYGVQTLQKYDKDKLFITPAADWVVHVVAGPVKSTPNY